MSLLRLFKDTVEWVVQLGCNLENVLLKVLCYYKLCEVLGGGLDSIAKRRHRVQLGVHETNGERDPKIPKEKHLPSEASHYVVSNCLRQFPLVGKSRQFHWKGASSIISTEHQSSQANPTYFAVSIKNHITHYLNDEYVHSWVRVFLKGEIWWMRRILAPMSPWIIGSIPFLRAQVCTQGGQRAPHTRPVDPACFILKGCRMPVACHILKNPRFALNRA